MSTEYQAHATRQQVAAKTAYVTWMKGLTPDGRVTLKRLGVLDAPDDSSEVGGHSPLQLADIADSPMAQVNTDFATHADTPAEILADQFGVDMERAQAILDWHSQAVDDAMLHREADLLAVVVGGLLASKNVRIASAGLAFASGMAAANGLGSQADYARAIGVSRTLISKAVKAWQRSLNLHTSAFQKSEEACETYSQIAKARHWRNQKVTATALSERLRALTLHQE